MDREFIFREFKTETFQLRPDGLIGLAGMIVPQTSALNNVKIGNGIVDKEAGEGGLLTIKAPEGRVEARFARGQWRVVTDIPALQEEFGRVAATQESLFSGAPSSRSAEVQFPMPDPMPTARAPRLFGVIATLAVLAAVAVFGFYTFEEPINRVADAHAERQKTRATEAEIRLLDAKRKDDYRALEKNVRTARAVAVETISAVEKASKALAAEVFASTKVSLPELNSNPDTTPREIDQLLRRDPSFLGAWNQVLNAYVSEQRLDENRGRLGAIDAHDKAGTLQDADRIEAERIGGALDTCLKSIAAVKENLAIVQEKLASKRLQEKMSPETRSSP